MAAENEEFEFRLRAEREAKAPAAPSGDKSDLIPQKYAKPVVDNAPSLPFGLRDIGGAAEAAATVGTGMVGNIAGNVAGVGKRIGGAPMNEAADTTANVAHSMTYEPRTRQGRDVMEKVGGFMDSSKLAGMNPAQQVLIGSIPRTGVALPKPQSKPKSAPVEAPPVGAGAEKAVNELQRQRGVTEGSQKPADLAGQSAHEAAVLERDKVTTPLRQAAFRSGERVDAAPVLSLIGELEAKNPDKGVRSALKDVRDVIANATKGSQGKSLPAAGARVTPAELKKMQGQANSMDVAMADEVRQSINRLLEKTGDGALDGHTKQVLGQIKDKLVEGAPEGYRKYLSEYTRLSEPIDQFKAPGGARDKVTADAKAFNLLNPADKQNMIQSAFKSDTPGRALSELVRDTAHSPEAAQGVRAAYTDWLTQTDAMTNLPTAKGLVTRWEQTRDAARSSKLMTPDHIAAMDKIMDDIRDAGQKNVVRRGLATAGGWLFGSSFGHPILAAGAARDIVGGTSSAATSKAVGNAMMQIAADPAGAKALAAPPTPANVAKIRAMLPADIAAAIVPTEARDEPVRRRSNPLSMQPRF